MIDLGSTAFYISVPSLSRSDLESYSSRLFDIWEPTVTKNLGLEDYALTLEVEEGSIKGSGKILAALGVLYAGICSYGSFIQGLETIGKQAVFVGDILAENARSSSGVSSSAVVVKKKGGQLGQLRRLFTRIHRREITVDEATKEAATILGEEANAAPDFMDRLNDAFKHVSLHPQQTILPFVEIESESVLDEPTKKGEPPVSRQRHRPVIPPSQQLRVEVSRDSKYGKKKIKVIDL